MEKTRTAITVAQHPKWIRVLHLPHGVYSLRCTKNHQYAYCHKYHMHMSGSIYYFVWQNDSARIISRNSCFKSRSMVKRPKTYDSRPQSEN